MDARGYTVKYSMKGSRSHEEKRGNHCHRFSVTVTAKWMERSLYVVLPFYGRELVSDFGEGIKWEQVPYDF